MHSSIVGGGLDGPISPMLQFKIVVKLRHLSSVTKRKDKSGKLLVPTYNTNENVKCNVNNNRYLSQVTKNSNPFFLLRREYFILLGCAMCRFPFTHINSGISVRGYSSLTR